MEAPTQAIEVFYSYSHKDERLRKQLETHLRTLERQGFIAGWHDRNISAGKEWETEIDTHLNSAGLILLLISPDFMASDYCDSIETKRATERHQEGTARVIPVILRPCDLKGTFFERLQALPTGAKAITTWRDRDQALQNVSQGLRAVIEELRAQTAHKLPVLPLWSLPYRRNPFFTGREDLLNELHDYLTRGHTAAITQPPAITGLGGIGKTQLAIEYAYRHKQEYQYVFWITAASRETLIEGFVSIAKLLALPSQDDDDQLRTVSAVQQWLAGHHEWLLILDNADDAVLVRDFLPNAEYGHLLLTTRERAWGTLAQSFEVQKMWQDEGVLFLLRRAKILPTPESPLTQASENEQTEAQAIVYALDGLPLALDQAGAYIEETSSSLASYLKAFERRKHELLQERGNEPGSHPNAVATTWSLNFEQVERLNPIAADLLRCLAFLAPDAIPEEMIVEGAEELGPQLQALTEDETLLDLPIKILNRFSLVQRNPNQHVLFIHRLVQAMLRATMTDKIQHQWAERIIRAISQALPNISVETWEEWEHLLPHARACADLINKYSLDLPEAARLLNQIGSYMNHYAQSKHAKPLYERALAICEQVFGPEHPDTSQSLDNLALLYRNQGDYEHAKPLYERALAICEQVLGPEHPDTATSLTNLAGFYRDQGDYEHAKPLCERALAIREQVFGPEHPDTARSLNNLTALYERTLAICEQVLGPEHPDVAMSLNNLAFLYYAQGRYEEAEPLYKQALAIWEEAFGPEHPDVAMSLNNLALLYYAQSKYEEAELLYKQALTIYEQVLGPNHLITEFVRGNHARLLQEIQGSQLNGRARPEE